MSIVKRVRKRGCTRISAKNQTTISVAAPSHRAPNGVALVRRLVTDVRIRIEPLNEQIAKRAARLRAHHRTLRLPDALVLATAGALDATPLTCDRSWARLSRRARVV